MKFFNTLATAAAVLQSTGALAAPSSDVAFALEDRAQYDSQYLERSTEEDLETDDDLDLEGLWKRKGGGRGGGSSGGSKGGGSKSSPSKSNPSTSKPAPGSSSSNVGGKTTTGSGPTPRYGAGGVYYPGGATVPYQSGKKSKNITPVLLLGSSVAFLGAAYIYGAYSYPYSYKYYYHNATTDKNETKPLECLCAKFETCSCEDNGDKSYYDSIIGNGSYDALNKSLVVPFDNSSDSSASPKLLILGTLPNGTTASGGTEPPNAAGGRGALLEAAGWWPLVVTGLAFAIAA